MPRTDTPVYSTYTTKQFPLVKEVFQRSNSNYDALYENCYIETLKSKDIQQFDIAAAKRDGTTEIASGAVGALRDHRGIHYSSAHDTLYYAIGQSLIAIKQPLTGLYAPQIIFTFTNFAGPVGFTDFLYSTGVVKVIFTDGSQIGEIDGTTLTINLFTSPNLFQHVPDPVYLDGYLFLLKSGSQDVYNSDLDDPSAWNNEYISAEMSPDYATSIAKIANYIVVFGSDSIEFLYNAQNSGGSPLGRNDTVYKHVGYAGGKADYGNKLYFIGKNESGSTDIFVLEETKLTPIGNLQVTRTLNRQTTTNTPLGAVVAFNGKTHYVFTYGNITFAYNTENDMYCIWKYKSENSFRIVGTANMSTRVYGNQSWFIADSGLSNGVLGKFVLDNYTDNGSPFTFKVRTENLFNDTLQMKFISRLSVFCDSGNTDATMQLRWTDNDYRTYSNPISIRLNQELASVRRLGGYRRRAFEFSNSENYPIRMWGFELDLNMGAS